LIHIYVFSCPQVGLIAVNGFLNYCIGGCVQFTRVLRMYMRNTFPKAAKKYKQRMRFQSGETSSGKFEKACWLRGYCKPLIIGSTRKTATPLG
jgi:hypothetical protein